MLPLKLVVIHGVEIYGAIDIQVTYILKPIDEGVNGLKILIRKLMALKLTILASSNIER